jgi:hypothetical protein
MAHLRFRLVLSAAVVAVPTPFPSAARESRLLLAAAAALALAAIGRAAAATWEGAPAFEPREGPGTGSSDQGPEPTHGPARPRTAPPAGRRRGIFYYENYENSSWK